MIAADLSTAGLITAGLAGVAGLMTAVRAWLDSRHKADETWVDLVEKASKMLEERVERVELSEAKCQRNVETLRRTLIAAGIPVPTLE